MPKPAPSSPVLRLWGWPLLMGLLTASGLVAALVSDEWGDAWSWLALGCPVATMAWFGLRRSVRAPTPFPTSDSPQGP